jgi:hypothetical protein
MLPLLFALVFVGGGVPVAAHTAPGCPGDSVVRKVSFENTSGLPSTQIAKLNKLLMGRCFSQADGGTLSEAVYHQLRAFGYRKVFVQDAIIRVLDRNLQPSPVSVTIDFVLTNPDGTKRK